MKRLISQVLLGGILLSGIPLGSSTVDAAVPLDTLTPDAAVESRAFQLPGRICLSITFTRRMKPRNV